MPLNPRIEYSEQPLESIICGVCDHNKATKTVMLTFWPEVSEGVECSCGFNNEILACDGCAEVLKSNATPLEEI